MIPRRYVPLFIVMLLTWAVYGLFGMSTGSLLPAIGQSYRISYTLQGLLVTISSVGSVVGSLLGGLIVERHSPRASVLTGLALAALSLAAILLARNYGLAMVLMFLMRMGLRTMEIGNNTLAVELRPQGSAVVMGLIHLFSSVGATLGTLYVAWALGVGWGWMSIMALISLPVTVLWAGSAAAPVPPPVPQPAAAPRGNAWSLLKSPVIWILGGMLTFSMLLEGGVGTWGVTYLQNARAMAADKAVLMLSAYCTVMMAGRMVCGLLAEKVGYLRYYAVSILLGAGVVAALAAGGAPWLMAAAGLFIAGGYPIFMSEVGRRYSGRQGAVFGIVISLASAGGLLGQLLLGAMADVMGVRNFFWLIPLAGLISAALSGMLMMKDRRQATNGMEGTTDG